MRVTRQFARDHGLELPDGYYKDQDGPEKSGQLSLYEKHQQDTTGLPDKRTLDQWRGGRVRLNSLFPASFRAR